MCRGVAQIQTRMGAFFYRVVDCAILCSPVLRVDFLVAPAYPSIRPFINRVAPTFLSLRHSGGPHNDIVALNTTPL